LRNRKSINLKKVRNHEAKKDSKKKFKDIEMDSLSYDLTQNAFNRKKFRQSYYLFKAVKWPIVAIDLLLVWSTIKALIEAISNTRKMGHDTEFVIARIISVILVLIFLMLIISLIHHLRDSIKGVWTDRCHQLLAILKHDDGSYWNQLSGNEKNILHEYISNESIKMQKIKLKKLTYGDFITVKNNLEYLQSIKCLSYMPEIHAMNFNVNSFGNYSLGALEDRRKE
jgi:hypothetical protein